MEPLPRPYDILELADGQSITLQIKGFADGTMKIVPKGQTAEKEIRVLRVVVPPEIKTTGVPYWDITATTLVAQLQPYLYAPGYQTKKFTITAHGIAPMKRFTLKVSP
jgi:hypothetical protein